MSGFLHFHQALMCLGQPPMYLGQPHIHIDQMPLCAGQTQFCPGQDQIWLGQRHVSWPSTCAWPRHMWALPWHVCALASHMHIAMKQMRLLCLRQNCNAKTRPPTIYFGSSEVLHHGCYTKLEEVNQMLDGVSLRFLFHAIIHGIIALHD